MKTLSKWLYRVSSGWVALAGLIIFLAFIGLVLPDQAAQAEVYSGDLGSPDSSIFYTADQLAAFAEAYGPQGREAYIQARWTFDVAWPLVYTLFLTTSISWLLKKSGNHTSRLALINLLPVFGMALDFMENTAASIVMARFPRNTPILAHLSGVFTAFKWILIALGFAALILAIFLMLGKLIKKPKQSSE